jgi:hypothetical protein
MPYILTAGHSTDSFYWHSTCILSVCPWLSKPPTTPERTKAAELGSQHCRSGPAFCSPFFGGGFMNRLRFGFLGLGLLLAVSAAQAQETRVKANIPFDFAVGDKILPAGEYMVVTEGSSNQAIVIRSDDRKSAILSLTQACSSLNPSDKTKLVFHTLAGRYFLSQVWMQGYDRGRELPRSKAEVQLAKNHNPAEEFIVAASLTR